MHSVLEAKERKIKGGVAKLVITDFYLLKIIGIKAFSQIIPISLVVRISASHPDKRIERGWPGFNSPIGRIIYFFLHLQCSEAC